MTIGGLGSGLDFLYDENAADVQVKKTLRVSELEPNRDQPRKQFSDTEKTLSAYKNTAYVLLGGALCKAWQLIFSCFSLCALVKRCLHSKFKPTGWRELHRRDQLCR